MSTPGRPTRGFFHGSELTRLLLMVSIVVAGGGMLYSFYERDQANQAQQAGRPEPPRAVAGGEPLPPPASGIEFEGLRDKTRLSPRDNPAYLTLIEKVRETPPDQLAKEARTDVFFTQLVELPERYRGLPIHLEGTALRIMRQEAPGSKIFPRGRFFEAYVTTPDSSPNPYILIFEDAPAGLPIADRLQEPVRFDGYFLKLMAYQAGDTGRFAPLLIGRLKWYGTAPPAPGRSEWWYWVVGILVVLLLIRMAIYARGFFGRPAPRPWESPTPRVRDEISADELTAWVEEQADEEEDEDPEESSWR